MDSTTPATNHDDLGNAKDGVRCSAWVGEPDKSRAPLADSAGSGRGGRSLSVAVLYARADSHYKTMPGCDVWDLQRDARKFTGGMPIVAHPPCRAWGCLSHMAKPRPDEKDYARQCVRLIRENGGVLEHPFRSKLWPDMGLPTLGARDEWGGFSVAIPQIWFGHCMEKATKLYVCGCEPRDLPPIPLSFAVATHAMGGKYVHGSSKRLGRDGIIRIDARSPKIREGTPPDFAAWLVEVARRCVPSGRRGRGAGDDNGESKSGACSPTGTKIR